MVREKDMKKNKTSISNADSYKAIGDYWDRHDLSKHWGKTQPVNFSFSHKSEKTYFSLGKTISRKINKIAQDRGVSGNDLLNLWVSEKLKSA